MTPAGYCRHHKRLMSFRNIKKKKCLNRRCWHLIKFLQHPSWDGLVRKAPRVKHDSLKEGEGNG